MKILKFLKYASVAGLCVVSVSIAASQALCEDQTLKVAISGDIDNFDPATNQLIAFQAAIANTVFDSLAILTGRLTFFDPFTAYAVAILSAIWAQAES